MHTPFCVVKCGYCDFNSYAGVDDDAVQAVLSAMLDELRLRARGLRPRTVFVGGGTPTWLGAQRLAGFLKDMAAIVDLSGVEEFTCEANPESATAETLQLAAGQGVTRFSIGAQSFDRERLNFLDRPHSAEDTMGAFAAARATGAAVNLDLIFGLPGETMEQWLSDLSTALDCGPDHLSCYALTYERGTPLHARRARGEVRAAPEERTRDMLLETRAVLGDAGYDAYEISNYARPEQACLHNLNYWHGGAYIGIGPGAASHRSGRRSTNVRALGTYLRWVRDRQCACDDAETLSPERRCREAIWLALRVVQGAHLDTITNLTGIDPRVLVGAEIAAAIDAGHCELVRGALRLLPAGLPFADGIAADFL